MAQRDWDHKLQGNLREILFLSMLVSLTKIETLSLPLSLSLSLSLSWKLDYFMIHVFVM